MNSLITCLLVDDSISEIEVSDVQISILDSSTELQKETITGALTTIDLATVRNSVYFRFQRYAKAIDKTLEHLDIETAQLKQKLGRITQKLANSKYGLAPTYHGFHFEIYSPLCSGIPFAHNNLEYPEQILSHANKNCVLIGSPALLKH